MSREAMQMALEALNRAKPACFADTTITTIDDAITALRQALETEQEPVAWMYVNKDGECEQIEYGPVFDDPGVTPLYTAPPKRELTCVCGAVWEGEMMVHPPRKREWVGLTDEEIKQLWKDTPQLVGVYSYTDISREVEAKLKEKNT